MAGTTLTVISGASRGLGHALALRSLAAGHRLITLARSSLSLPVPGSSHQHIQTDLATVHGAAQACTALLEMLRQEHAERFVLINNAGTVDPVAQTADLLDAQAIARALQLNLASVMNLTAAFMQGTPATARRQVLNISSGAGRKPVSGWAVYGVSKAALDFYTQTLQLENPSLQACSMAPGVIDTDMQSHIRQQSRDDFPGLNRFLELHQHGQLSTAHDTADRILRHLDSPAFGSHTLDDIRHYE
ncbi:MAG TPA: SDR family NAD(P)-dependent oxidoreductase [Alcaligenes sp.]|nr:SDR family NAD(P)-dependent oxidoreductase [Alcaligenes sp.]HRL28485.1 SDR family NAD(P)-dependent oxidoreductase [Alcaligenes sp.]